MYDELKILSLFGDIKQQWVVNGEICTCLLNVKTKKR